MQLHQLLRYIHSAVPILLFNLKGYQIASVRTKENLDVDLYEYDVLDITIGKSNIKGCDMSLYITLEK